MNEDERRALWAAALGVSQDELYARDEPVAEAVKKREEPLRRAG